MAAAKQNIGRIAPPNAISYIPVGTWAFTAVRAVNMRGMSSPATI
jgi:hypothetical protein